MLPLLLAYLLVTGVMTYFQKVAVNAMGWQTTLFWTWATAFVLNMVVVLPKVDFALTRFSLLGIGIGVAAAATTLCFYVIMDKWDISNYIPIMALYIVIPVLLSAVFLKDHLSFQKILGIVFAIASIILINWRKT